MSPGSVTGNDIVGIRLFQERGHLSQVELPIRVGEENYIVPRPLDAALERGPVAPVSRMMNNTHLGELHGQLVADVPRAIFTAGVHHNDLNDCRNFSYDPTRVLSNSPDICRFV